MIKKIILLLLISSCILAFATSCSDTSKATAEVIKEKIYDQIQSSIGKGDIAIKKYEIKIKGVKDSLIKTKVSIKLLERKIQDKKISIDRSPSPKSEIAFSSVKEMEAFLFQMRDAENKIEETLKEMISNFDLIKEKVNALEVRKEMMDTLSTVEQYTNIDSSIGGISSDLDKTIKSIEHDALEIEAELEVNKIIKNL